MTQQFSFMKPALNSMTELVPVHTQLFKLNTWTKPKMQHESQFLLGMQFALLKQPEFTQQLTEMLPLPDQALS